MTDWWTHLPSRKPQAAVARVLAVERCGVTRPGGVRIAVVPKIKAYWRLHFAAGQWTAMGSQGCHQLFYSEDPIITTSLLNDWRLLGVELS